VEEIARKDLFNLRILLVDDDEACRKFLALGLEQEGMIVTQAPSAEDAIKILQSSYFDAVATDVNLPEMDGVALLRFIREDIGKIPVILITGYGSVGSAVDALKLGAQDYLSKPFENVDKLASSIWRSVERHRLSVQNQALQERLVRAERMESLANLAGGVAHDLNNILSPLVSLPDLIVRQLEKISDETGCDVEMLKEDMGLMKASSQRATAVVRDLLVSSRNVNVDKRPMDLNKVIMACLASQEVKELSEGMPDLVVDSDLEKDPLLTSASAPHVSRAVFNLIRNSLESMDERITGRPLKECRLTVTTRNLDLVEPLVGYDIVKQGKYVRVRVSDTGMGIDDLDVQRIFEPFFSRKKESGRSGSGLGLAVVHGVMTDHDGYIDVKSIEGKGTIVDLYFLSTEEQAGSADVLLHAKVGTESVLVVDDEPSQRIVAERLLREMGYRVALARDGHEAVVMVNNAQSYTSDGHFDLILLDMIMEEDFDGLETLTAVRKIRPDQKVIVASGFAPTGRIQAAIDMGAGWLAKPYDMHNLSAALREQLDVEDVEDERR
jgi:CheY-like chemotaxis protein